jgi:hypothetical protein
MEPDADHETDAGHKPDPDDEDVISRLDAMVEPIGEPENAVLTDNAKLVRWAGPMFALFAVILLPWIVYIGITLPSRQLSPNYDIAWTGFDLMLFSALASTAYFALRRSRYLSTAAVASAVLLTADAWFDVMTTPGTERIESVLLCLLVELPLAGLCLWLSHHTLQISERRVVLLKRLAGRPARERVSVR